MDLGLATPTRSRGIDRGVGDAGLGLGASRQHGLDAWATPGRAEARDRSARRLTLGLEDGGREGVVYGEENGGHGKT